MTTFLIAENDAFKIEHCYSCALPGYLIVSPAPAVSSLTQLPPSHQQQLGPTLALATQAIQQAIRPIRIYCAQFGEQDDRLHFHVFPRTHDVTAAFLRVFPEQETLIHGPVLLDWARAYYSGSKEEVRKVVAPVIQQLREAISSS
jgi:diadenosine tetraphosphate (Ap4A) HIT family hydrolase